MDTHLDVQAKDENESRFRLNSNKGRKKIDDIQQIDMFMTSHTTTIKSYYAIILFSALSDCNKKQ